MKRLGTKLSMDDFGTGHSSLNQLRTLPADIVKIDGSFVTGLSDDGSAMITGTVIKIGHSLGLKVVAEYIETEAQLNELRELRCDSGRCWLFSRAVDPRSITELISSGVMTTETLTSYK